MKFRTSFILSVHLMALASFQALIQTHELPLIFSLLIVTLIVTSFVLNLKYKSLKVNKSLVNGVIFGAAFFFLGDWIYWSRGLLMASTHFLNLLLIIKLFTLKRSKDYIQLFVVSFLQVLAASAMSIQISFAVSLLVYLMMATWGMILYQMKADIEYRNQISGFQDNIHFPETFESEEVVTFPLVVTTLGVGVISFVFTLMIFFMIPRMGAGFFQKKEGEEIRTSGFSEKADFGSLAPIKLDSTTVMRVSMSSAPFKIYIKGTSFNVYDGKGWKNTLHVQKNLSADEEIPAPLKSESIITQEYVVEPMDTLAIFALSQPVRLEGGFRSFNQDQMGNLTMQINPGNRLAYKIISSLPVISRQDREAKVAQIPLQSGGQTYVEYPFPHPEKLEDLARHASEGTSTLLEKASAVQQYLKNNYTYSLNVSPSKEYSPMEDFLFHQKKGYCEHFATAMVLMMRSLGIPSRLATGYSPEEWNPYGNYFKVRQSDAHAWVEVYFPNSGWITFDPTPEGRNSPLNLTLTAQLKKSLFPVDQMFDALRLKWDRYVVHYSIQDQMEVGTVLQKKGTFYAGYLKEKIHRLSENPSRYQKSAAVLILIISGAVLIYFGIKKLYPNGFGRPFAEKEENEAVTYYLKLLQILSRYHLNKKPQQTPHEFLAESEETLHLIGDPFYPGAERLTELYYQNRFGEKDLSQEERKRSEDLLKTLREFSTPSRN
ncbi:MAG: DUF3488 domain-containing protein [Nitrospirae bacterium]|nr:DUF3488 domain-containing protein [Nitrospirota bacterium]